MRAVVRASTVDEILELEREMEAQGRVSKANALREVLRALVKPSRGWITTGDAAGQLGVSIPTVKAWIGRGALAGRQVGERWWISQTSVDELLRAGSSVAALEEDNPPDDDEVHRITKRVRGQMASESPTDSVGELHAGSR